LLTGETVFRSGHTNTSGRKTESAEYPVLKQLP